MATRPLEQNICAQKLLESHHRVQLVEATPNFLKISSYLSVFDPHTLEAILGTYRSMVTSSNDSKRKRKKKNWKALSDVSLSADFFLRSAKEAITASSRSAKSPMRIHERNLPLLLIPPQLWRLMIAARLVVVTME